MNVRAQEVDIARLTTLPLKLRPIDDEIVLGIAESMKAKGQEQDILVRRFPDGAMRVVYGEHRLAAARKVGLKTIRCRVEEMSDADELERKLIENLHRNARVDPVAEGEIFERLMLEKYHAISALAQAIGKPENYVRVRLALKRELSPKLQQFVGNGLTIENALALSRLATEEIQVNTAEAMMKAVPLDHRGAAPTPRRSEKRAYCECPTCGDRHLKRRTDWQ